MIGVEERLPKRNMRSSFDQGINSVEKEEGEGCVEREIVEVRAKPQKASLAIPCRDHRITTGLQITDADFRDCWPKTPELSVGADLDAVEESQNTSMWTNPFRRLVRCGKATPLDTCSITSASQKSSELTACYQVSGDKRRFSTCQFDLDLSYITPSIIAMSMPASSLSGIIFRNRFSDVRAFLKERHGTACKVRHPCSYEQR